MQKNCSVKQRSELQMHQEMWVTNAVDIIRLPDTVWMSMTLTRMNTATYRLLSAIKLVFGVQAMPPSIHGRLQTIDMHERLV